MNPLMNLSPLFGSSKLPSSPAVNVGLDIMDQAFNQRTLEGFRAQLWGRMAKEAGARSVLAERRMEGVETSPVQATSPVPQVIVSPAQTSPQQSPLFSSPSEPSSPQQSSGSSSSSPLSQTISSSPSLSMLNQPATLRSLFENASSRFESTPTSTPAQQPSTSMPSLFPSSTPTPALLQASSFGAGFLGSTSGQSTFAQSAASIQARAMLQAQWLALQQARQQNAGSSAQPMSSSSAQPISSSSVQPNAQSTQREVYLAHFAQAAAAQQAQQQAQQSQLSGLAAGVRPAYFASAKEKEKDLVSAMSGLSLDKAKADKKLVAAISERKPVSAEKKPVSAEKKPVSTEKKGTTPQQAALVASLASQTLLQRMGSAFWDAFSSGTARDVDTNKVRRVLEGKAVVRVVDVDVDAIEERMKGVSLERGVFGNLRGKK